jgi:hypothetical protein
MDQNKIPCDPHHLGVPSGVSKMISDPMVCLTETMHLCCTDGNSISKQTKTRFHMTLVTQEFHRVRPKWFFSPWYIWRKPYTYLASRLALSPNRPKWASSPKSSIRCIQNDFSPYGTFDMNRVPILHQHELHLQMDQNNIPHEPRQPGVSSGASDTISDPMVIWRKLCTYLALTLISSLNRPKWDSTWATSPRHSISFIQNDFQAYGTFGANLAPI